VQQRKWNRANPDKVRAKRHRRRARERNNGGSFNAEEWAALKAQYNYTCLRCGKREPEITLTPDHVIPVSKGGSSDISNIQPLCGSCNSSKGDKTTDYRPRFDASRAWS
jgi:5-methylcytosine-specific restriction endonuclease McrA